ncbi:hypothetical protein BB560_006923 [Smittium megazygosporum]|uniref:IST1 homolog n=1 Tax=Smittium megazygosporum TaxID=133381 RepID=A0A2T9Y076_9FUNG|nr:hypothetical protein BB560_006923 [Smittium megazygosporum]
MSSKNASTKLRLNTKLAINRLKLLQQKKRAINDATVKDVAFLLEAGKLTSAQVKVEKVIQQDYFIEGLEITELYLEKLSTIISMLDHTKPSDKNSLETLASVIYASSRADVKELLVVKDLIGSFFGRDFMLQSLNNTNEIVDPKLVSRLNIQFADPKLVDEYLKGIAASYNVSNYKVLFGDDSDSDSNGGLKEKSETKVSVNSDKASEPSIPALPSPYSNSNRVSTPVPNTVQKKQPTKEVDPNSFEGLMARFEALKKP